MGVVRLGQEFDVVHCMSGGFLNLALVLSAKIPIKFKVRTDKNTDTRTHTHTHTRTHAHTHVCACTGAHTGVYFRPSAR